MKLIFNQRDLTSNINNKLHIEVVAGRVWCEQLVGSIPYWLGTPKQVMDVLEKVLRGEL